MSLLFLRPLLYHSTSIPSPSQLFTDERLTHGSRDARSGSMKWSKGGVEIEVSGSGQAGPGAPFAFQQNSGMRRRDACGSMRIVRLLGTGSSRAVTEVY
jgi:hypothetical protein